MRSVFQCIFYSLSHNFVDIELIYDNALLRVNYEIALKFNIKYILAGTNTTSEGMAMPPNMNWFKYDKKNIKSIIKNLEIIV